MNGDGHPRGVNFWTCLRASTSHDRVYVALTVGLSVLLTVFLLWLPEIYSSLRAVKDVNFGIIVLDGRLAAYTLTTIVSGLVATYFSSKHRSQNTYPILLLCAIVSVILSCMFLTISIENRPALLAGEEPKTMSIGLIQFWTIAVAIFVTFLLGLLRLARTGEDRLLDNVDPNKADDKKSREYQDKVEGNL